MLDGTETKILNKFQNIRRSFYWMSLRGFCGNLLCQYTGRNINVYRKKSFDAQIIHIFSQFKCGIILSNYDTKHMVDLINLSLPNLTTTRT